jgi:5-methylcytosine-specific restriction endonuclease McrA
MAAYAPGFDRRLKARILDRDGNACQVCGKEIGKLNVHHIDDRKEDHSPSNLLTLCQSCHSRCHGSPKPLVWHVKLSLIAALRIAGRLPS